MSYESLCSDYKQNFDAKAYRDVSVNDFINVYHFFIRQLHDIFETDVRGSTILDIGCGPTVYTALVASRTFDNIVLSDFLSRNREQVEKWVKNDATALDWSPIIEYVARVECFNNLKKGSEEIAQRTRKTISRIIPCDITTPDIVPETHRAVFDAVVSSLCLESAIPDDIACCSAIADIAKLICPGGHVVLCGLTGNLGYVLGQKTFKCFSYPQELVEFALTGAGFMKKGWIDAPHEALGSRDSLFDTAFVTWWVKL
uniref:Putative nicotinamide n-methyltransferase n=1 Tax=Ornithodoros turicata TaxID=34597 RepID=A0A2R5LHD1_9ACAR